MSSSSSPAPTRPRLLPGELANGARAITRGVVLALLDHDGGSRVRVGWAISPDALTLSVRDDGDGALTVDALSAHRVAERVAALGGTLRVDATAGWGTLIAVELPLAPLRGETPPPDPLAVLNAREREVLPARRRPRNREIAEALSITTHTVKFHVANILRKLDVGTRGQAAALAALAAGHRLAAARRRMNVYQRPCPVAADEHGRTGVHRRSMAVLELRPAAAWTQATAVAGRGLVPREPQRDGCETTCGRAAIASRRIASSGGRARIQMSRTSANSALAAAASWSRSGGEERVERGEDLVGHGAAVNAGPAGRDHGAHELSRRSS